MSPTDFDADEWARQAMRAIHGPASQAMEKMAADIQAILNSVASVHVGKDPAVVEAELRRQFATTDYNLPDEHLKAYAEAIAVGQPVKFEFDKSSLDSLL